MMYGVPVCDLHLIDSILVTYNTCSGSLAEMPHHANTCARADPVAMIPHAAASEHSCLFVFLCRCSVCVQWVGLCGSLGLIT